MSAKDDHKDLTRRGALSKIARTASAAITVPILNGPLPAPAASVLSSAAAAISAPYTPKFFNSQQMETIAAIAERIIPADGHSPGARAARVHEFIDIIIAESPKARKQAWLAGLAAIDRLAERERGEKFAACAADVQDELLGRISQHEGHPATQEEKFFSAIKGATIEGYYTSEIGIHKDLEYQGNTALAEFAGCVHAKSRPSE